MKMMTIISNAGYYARNRNATVYRVTGDDREYRTRVAAERRAASLAAQQPTAAGA